MVARVKWAELIYDVSLNEYTSVLKEGKLVCRVNEMVRERWIRMAVRLERGDLSML